MKTKKEKMSFEEKFVKGTLIAFTIIILLFAVFYFCVIR